MKRTIEEVKAEAIKRMKALKMYGNVIKDFERGVINESDVQSYHRYNKILTQDLLERCTYVVRASEEEQRFCSLCWINDKEKEIVKEFEKDGDRLVYHMIHDMTNIGELYNILYVSFDDEEWEYDMEDLKNGQALTYVLNKTYPDCSEYGTIGIRPSIGGLVRTW